ncbi:peptidoglycan-binding protein [Candidatus Nomurabacteria bacterium]|nr:peptidoglycan-binding protein [Candidatus Nomurabacteria bacterium]
MVYVRLTRYAYPGDPTGGGHLDTNNNNLIPNSVGGVGSAAADTNIIPSGSIIETPDGLTLVNHDYGPDVNSKEATKSNSAIDEIKNIYGGGVNPKDTKEFDSPVIDVYDPNNENKDNTNKWTWVCVSPGNEPTKNNGSPKISKNNLKDIFDKAKKLSDERKGETPPSKEDPPNDQQPPQNSTPPNLGDDNLGRGSDGQNVSDLQNFLKENGYLDPDSPNGHFGPLTEEAVKAFQADHGLTPDGVVGPQTKDAIYNQFQNTPPASVAPTNAPGFADNNVQNNFFAPNNLADLGKNIINTSFNGLNNFINNTVSFFGDIFGKNKDPKNKETSITKKDPIPFKVDNKPIYGCTSPTACNYNPKATTGYDSCIFCNVIATTLIEKNSPPQTEAPTGEVASNKFSLADVREAVVENKESLQKEFDEEIKHQEEQANLNFAEKTLGNLFSKRFWKSTLIPNSCNPYFTKNLAPGDFDSEVSEVIAFINTTVGKNLVETPGYDDKVVSAVKEFQLMFYDQILLPNNQTEPNGIWDDITRATANNILGCTEKVKTESLGKITPTITEKPSPEAETKVSEEIKISFEAPIREVVVECRTQQGAHTYKSADPSFVQKITSGEVSACSIYDSVVKKDTPKTTNNCTSVNVLSAQGSLVTKGCVETSQSSTSASFDNNSTKNSVFNSISF